MYTNELEIRIFSMRRSGTHAIINWLSLQSPCQIHYFNNAPNSGESPFFTGKKRGEIKGTRLSDIWVQHESYKHSSQEKIEKIRNIHKEILMYNYEDLNLRKLQKVEYPNDREMTVGKSRKRIDVIILRDLINWAASKLYISKNNQWKKHRNAWQDLAHFRFEKNRKNTKWFCYYDGWEEDAKWIRGLNYINMNKYIDIWLSYAKEIMEETNILENLVFINYNRWNIDKEYRKQIIDNFPGFAFTDEGHNVLASMGGGSSFTGRETLINDSSFLERWKFLQNNKIFRNLIKYHSKQLNYNDKIFGKNHEIEKWINNRN